MLSYQHGYHAGCFADVVKHFTLTRIFDYLVQKDKPLFYLETHSGRGLYDLHDKQALKTGESRLGIEPLWAMRDELPSVFLPYIQAITRLNSDNVLQFYPGSPLLATELLRTQDRLHFCELHPTEFDCLNQSIPTNKRIVCENKNGYECLKSMLPPIERRGVVFIDPSYEVKTEYRDVVEALQAAIKRFATGISCLWYPIIDKSTHEQLIRGLEALPAKSHLQVEFYSNDVSASGMKSSGLWILNPPYRLSEELEIGLQAVCRLLYSGQSSYLVASK